MIFDAASDGRHIILGMLVVGLVFLAVIALGELDEGRPATAARPRRAELLPSSRGAAGRPARVDRAARARGRARPRRRGGRPAARGDGDRRPDGAGRRPGAALRASAGSEHPLLVNQFGTERRMCLALRRRAARRRGREARERARDAAAGRARREAARPQAAQVDRRLAAEHRAQGRVPGGRPPRRRGRPRPAAGADVLAARRGAVHHAAGRDHARPAHRRAERRHVPHAGARAARDGDALAAAQGRPRRLPAPRAGGWRSRSRSGSTR